MIIRRDPPVGMIHKVRASHLISSPSIVIRSEKHGPANPASSFLFFFFPLRGVRHYACSCSTNISR